MNLILRNCNRWLMATAVCVALHGTAFGQVSVNDDLDSCVRKERVKSTAVTGAKGAAAGAVAGGAIAKGKQLWEKYVKHEEKPKDNTVNAAGIGAAIGGLVGGAVGFNNTYYTAVSDCYKQNPAWIPESDIKRTKSFSATRVALNYDASMGIVVRAVGVSMPQTIKAGNVLRIVSTFQVMTPNGTETPVIIERKLYAIVNEQETELPFTGKGTEQRTVEPGEQTSVDHVPIPDNVVSGTAFRVAYLVSAAGQPASTASAKVTVQ